MQENNSRNFFTKLGHSLNLENKRYNNALKKGLEPQEGTSPIDDTADLMSTDSMDEQQNGGNGMETQPIQPEMDAMPDMGEIEPQMPPSMPTQNNGMDGGEDGMDMQDNDDMSAPAPMEDADQGMDNGDNAMDSDIMQPEQDSSMDGMDPDMDNGEDMDEPEASLAATTVAKKHTAETKSMPSEHADGLLRPIDVYETKNEIIVKAIVAGVERGAIKVSITPESVTISGERQKQERISRDSYFYQELFWGSFSRSIMLPVEVDPDNAKASLKNGIFTIRLPKIEQQKERILSMDDIEEG